MPQVSVRSWRVFVFFSAKVIPTDAASVVRVDHISLASCSRAGRVEADTQIRTSSTYDIIIREKCGVAMSLGLTSFLIYAPNKKGESGDPWGIPLLVVYLVGSSLVLWRNCSVLLAAQWRIQGV